MRGVDGEEGVGEEEREDDGEEAIRTRELKIWRDIAMDILTVFGGVLLKILMKKIEVWRC